MHMFGLVVFLAVWLLILWAGSIALEATGLERSVARFQALNALSGVGFTTRQSESVVEYPSRRRIVSYLIFLGNTGIITLILLVIVYTRAGVELPSVNTIIIAVAALLAIGISVWLGLIDKLTNGIINLTGKKRGMIQNIMHRDGDYAVVYLTVGKESNIAGLSLKETSFPKQDATIFAIKRGDTFIPHPQSEEKLMEGDNVFCFGKLADISNIMRQS